MVGRPSHSRNGMLTVALQPPSLTRQPPTANRQRLPVWYARLLLRLRPMAGMDGDMHCAVQAVCSMMPGRRAGGPLTDDTNTPHFALRGRACSTDQDTIADRVP